ncbi:MAG: hypothetical protein SEPTF4163_004331 [Sporothrix epigloea]
MSSHPGRQTFSQKATHPSNVAAAESVGSSFSEKVANHPTAGSSSQGGGTTPALTMEMVQEAITRSLAAFREEVRPAAPPAPTPSAPLLFEPLAPSYPYRPPTAASSASFVPCDAFDPWRQQDLKLKSPVTLLTSDNYKFRGDWMDSILCVFRGAKRAFTTEESKVVYACHCMEPMLTQDFKAFARKEPVEDGVDPKYSWDVFTRWFNRVEKKAVRMVQAVEEYKSMRQALDETPVMLAGRLSAIEHEIELDHELFTANFFRASLLPWVKAELRYVASNAMLSRQELVEAAQVIWDSRGPGGKKREASPGPSDPQLSKAQKVEREGGPSVQNLGKRRPRGQRGRGSSGPVKCFACDQEGHFAEVCPQKSKGAAKVHRATTGSASRKGKGKAA